MILLLFAFAFAADPSGVAPITETPLEAPGGNEPASAQEHAVAPDAETAPPVATPALMEQARHRIRTADYPGTRLLLDAAAERPDASLEEIVYLRGVSYELDRDYATALATYTEGLRQFPDGTRSDDFAFRSAEVVGGLGDPDAALERLAPFVATASERAAPDRAKIRLVQGIWEVESGNVRRGMRLLADALSETDPQHARFYQAKARATVAAQWATDASRLHLDTRERRQVRRLTRRGETMLAIERQVTEIALLEEPEWVLDGLQTLGDAYALLGEDLLAARMPPRLDPSLHDLYRQTVADKAEVLLVKALNHYQRGLDLALRLGWQSRRVGELEAARTALQARIEATGR